MGHALALILALVAPMTSRPSPEDAAVRYHVSMPVPSSHYFHVRLEFEPGESGSERLVFPVWTPGSYLIREHGRHLQELEVRDERGDPLPWRKVEKNVWVVEPGTAESVVVTYRLYANELTVRTNHLNSDHGYFNGPAIFLYPEARRDDPVTLEIEPHGNWRIATALDSVPGARNLFGAASYDRLADCPVEIGPLTILEFTVRDVPHRFVLSGEGYFDAARLEKDIPAIIEQSASIFGGLPYDHYTFICHLTNRGGGGLEHANSCTIQIGRDALRNEKKYGDALELIAHEHFHAWNVKRIHAAAFDRLDYSHENYTRLLWIHEGITSYYDELLLVRAGLKEPQAYLEELARRLDDRARNPGRHVMSLAEASFDAWIKYYRSDENSRNSQVSYYSGGALAALVLDLTIRERSNGERSLDDVMRHLDAHHGPGQPGLGDDGMAEAVRRATGVDASDRIEALIRGRSDPDYAASLAWVGLELREKGPETRRAGEAELEKGYLGATTRTTEGRLLIERVIAGTPAAAAGLEAGDEIVALDGIRTSAAGFDERIAEREPGSSIMLTLFRTDVLREIPITLGRDPFPRYEIVAAEGAREAERGRFRAWCGQDLPAKTGD